MPPRGRPFNHARLLHLFSHTGAKTRGMEGLFPAEPCTGKNILNEL